MTFTSVNREPTPIMFVAKDGPPDEAAKPAFDELEAALPSLKGRRFYGYFDHPTGRYVACVAAEEGDDAGALGLEVGELPGGRYLRARLQGEPPALYGQISPTFDELAEAAGDTADRTRPWLEFYRREDEVDVLLPVAK